MRSVDLLGVRVDVVSMDDVLRGIDERLAAGLGGFLNTLNTNLLLNVDRYQGMRRLFNENDLNVADGVPLQWMARLRGVRLAGRVCGTDIVYRLCQLASQRGYRLFLLGAREEVARGAAAALEAAHPGLALAGTYSPPFQDEWDDAENARIVERIVNARANVVLVAFGFPKQEYWIQRHKERVPGCVFINVGGAFDVAAGVRRRAPRWMQRYGLEWVWRIIQEPRRLLWRYLRDGLCLAPRLMQWLWTARRSREHSWGAGRP